MAVVIDEITGEIGSPEGENQRGSVVNNANNTSPVMEKRRFSEMQEYLEIRAARLRPE